ncbi:MAG: polyphosphate kinase [Sphingomonas bacterium]|nr:polyphosphate kinase [Sphingomonas bacterium]
MPIDLTQFERGEPFAGDYHATLTALQHRLAQLQVAQIVHRKRALIIFEGWTGSGKRGALKRLGAAGDPGHISTRGVGGAEASDDERHWLAPFWSALPPPGDTTIFYRSWYRRLVEERSSGRTDDKRWSRACDEINEFEAQQRDHGTLLIKLFFHVTPDVQLARLRERQQDPWRRHLMAEHDIASITQRERTSDVLHDMFAQTDTRWAPWQVIDANDKHSGRIATLTALADVLTKAIPAEPPAEGEKVVPIRPKKSA